MKYGFGFGAFAKNLRGRRRGTWAYRAQDAGSGFFRHSDRTVYRDTGRGWVRLGKAGKDGKIVPGS